MQRNTHTQMHNTQREREREREREGEGERERDENMPKHPNHMIHRYPD